MFIVKHSIVSAAGFLGGVLGYVSVPGAHTWALFAAFAHMLVFAGVADFLTRRMEKNED